VLDTTSLDQLVRDIPDYPKPGVLFKDITPLLASSTGLALSIDALALPWLETKIDLVVGIEARGFIVATPVATRLNAGFVPVRKPGKLPGEVLSHTYDLEYGTDTLEMHLDAVQPGQRVLVVDDVLATGGTAAAAVHLLQECGAEVVGAAFLIELEFLGGRAKIEDLTTSAVLSYA
jgi:adenine phosphoribosyltransferase